MDIKVIEQRELFAKEVGRYKSFPTVVKTDSYIFLAFREGIVNPEKPHGESGVVRLFRSADAIKWDEISVPFSDNELDAIISGPFGEHLFLWTRSFVYRVKSDVYLSRFKVGESPTSRSIFRLPDATFCPFSHIRQVDSLLLGTGYGEIDGVVTPIIVESGDLGDSWSVRGLVTPDGFSPELNEVSLLPLDDGFIAVMRSREPSFELYYSFSKDASVWNEPDGIGILGQAPMLLKSCGGRVLFVFRDLMEEIPGVGLAVSDNFSEWTYFRIDKYTGDMYDGGYADIIELDRNEFFIVYYMSDENGSPWIRATFVRLF